MDNSAIALRPRWLRQVNARWFMLPVIVYLLMFFIAPISWFFIHSALTYSDGFAGLLWITFTSPLFMKVAWNTFYLSLMVTLIALIAAYPIAYSLTRAKALAFSLIIICVVVPYFTSLVVRTYSWMIILGNKGVVNELFLSLGLIDAPMRLMYNQFGVILSMAYVLLPYLVLTLYSSMCGIDRRLIQAASSMGASNWYVFRYVFLPLSMPGVISGFLIVFILALGFFVTPTLIGGPSEIMMAMLIQRNIEVTMDWAMASAMSLFLLVITLGVFTLYCRYTDFDQLLGRKEQA